MRVHVVSVSARGGHGLGKEVLPRIQLLTGLGVEGDAHCGETVKHRSRVAKDPTQPNLRQIHLIQSELFDDLLVNGFRLLPGALGENILTRGIDLLALPTGTVLNFPSGAEVFITGLRNPCHQINGHTPGLMNALLDYTADGALIRKAGVMGTVVTGGTVAADDSIGVKRPNTPLIPLQPV
jgi:MOSC domain-containing protein YiiM